MTMCTLVGSIDLAALLRDGRHASTRALCEIMVRGNAGVLPKSSREMMYRKSRNNGQGRQIDAVAQVRLHIFSDPTNGAGGQSAVCLRRWRDPPKGIDQVQSSARIRLALVPRLQPAARAARRDLARRDLARRDLARRDLAR
jgi:hypothetical protein